MVGYGGYNSKATGCRYLLYYATFGLSITVEQWLHTTYRKRTLVEVRHRARTKCGCLYKHRRMEWNLRMHLGFLHLAVSQRETRNHVHPELQQMMAVIVGNTLGRPFWYMTF